MSASRQKQCTKMANIMGRITSTVLNIVLFSALLQLSNCAADSSASNENEPQHFNISQDLLADTQSSGFNFSDWMCLDGYLSSWDMHPLELESIFANLFDSPQNHSVHNCKCFLNSRCEKKATAPASSSISNTHSSSSLVTSHQQQQISLWFRCYELEEPKALANFTEALSTSKLLGKLAIKLEACFTGIHSDNQAVSLRFDLVRGNRSNVQSAFEFINQLNSQANVHIESVSFRNSSLDSIPVSVLSNAFHLKSLNLTCNHLAEFDSTVLFSPESSKQLVTLDLSHNRLTRVNLSRLVSLHLLDLSFNHLSTLATSELSTEVVSLLKSLQQNKEKPLLYFNLANNPWNCDDRLDWLIDFIDAIVEANGTIFTNRHGLELSQTDEPECSWPQPAKVFPFSVWKSVKNVAICEKCACHLEAKYAEIGYRYVIVNCTDKNLDYLPVELPKNTKVIDLSNNQVRKLSGTTRAKLSQWHHVNKIILQNNSLEALDGLDQIHSIVYLDISGNLLTEIPYHILDRDKVLSSKIDKILIGNNPYTCDCNTVKMQKWLQTNYRIIHDIANVRCGYMRTELTKNESNIAAQVYNDRFHNREILKINNLELCPSIASVEIFDIINGILTFGIIFLLAKVTYDYFWQKRTGQLPRFWKLNI